MFGRPLFIEFLECPGQSRPRGVARHANRTHRVFCWAFFGHPAPGNRDAFGDRGFGGLRNVGNAGFSWSSTIAGTNAHNLNFNYSFLARQASKTPRGRVAGPPGRGSKEKTNGTYKTVRFFVFQEKHPIFALTV